jgi:endonuclease/exonuclease/phosphatase family metal-dependent hydrolase
MLAGDFNLIYRTTDKNTNHFNRAMMNRFKRLIEDLALKEIPLHGRQYTWSNQQVNPVLVKLDRVFCSVDWKILFPNVHLQSTASQDSDHCPLILDLKITELEEGVSILRPSGQNLMIFRILLWMFGTQFRLLLAPSLPWTES